MHSKPPFGSTVGVGVGLFVGANAPLSLWFCRPWMFENEQQRMYKKQLGSQCTFYSKETLVWKIYISDKKEFSQMARHCTVIPIAKKVQKIRFCLKTYQRLPFIHHRSLKSTFVLFFSFSSNKYIFWPFYLMNYKKIKHLTTKSH